MVNDWFGVILLMFTRRRQTHSTAYYGLLGVFLAAYILTESKEITTMAKANSKKASRRQKPPENETPAQAFTRLAQGRTNKAIKAISLIAQLTGSAYESSEIAQRAIVTALEASVEQVKEVFAGKAKSSDSFKLPE